MPEKIGKYDIIERIGRGGMGMVYKARDSRLNRFVAVKVISPDVEITDELRTRFIAEAQACAGLRHQNIVTIFDVGEENDGVFIVMELLDGQELKRLIAGGVEMDIEEKIWVMIQLCDAIHYAHQQGIIHRDIKPGNVIVQKDGSVKVIDFGIAKMVSGVSATRTGLVMGTIRYMSLEQVKGKADARSDQYSLGAVFYEMLTLRPPYLGDQPYELLEQMHSHTIPPVRELAPEVPADLASIIEKALSRDAPDRYPDLAEMRADLEDVQARIRAEADVLRQKLAPRIKELRDVMLQFRQRVGGNGTDEALPSTERTGRLKVLQRWDQQIDSRLSELRGKLDRVAVLEQSVRSAEESLRAGRYVDAIERCEAALAEVPEMAAAVEVLERARQAEEAQQRQLLARKLIEDARAALSEGDIDLCLSILEQASEIPPPPEANATIAALRQSANARREELARLQREAEQARSQVTAARRQAQGKGKPEEAAATWDEAEASVVAAETALGERRWAEAAAAFGAALSAFQRFEHEAAEEQKRKRDAEAQEVERKKREAEAKEAERKRREAEAKEAERKRREAETREAEQKKREAEAAAAAQKKRDADAKEAERKKREAEAREADRRQREAQAQAREEEKRRQQAEKEAKERRRREAAAKQDDRYTHAEAPTRVTATGAADPTWSVDPEDRTVVREISRTGRRARGVEQGTPGHWQTAAMMSAVAFVAFVGISGGIYLMGAPSEPVEEPAPGAAPAQEAGGEAAAERAVAEKVAAEEKAAAENAAAENTAAENAAAEKAASEKAASERAENERERSEAAKQDAARAEAEARAKTAAEQRERDAAARLEAEEEALERSATERARAERAERERDAAARAKAEQAERDREAAREKTEKMERDRAEAERAERARKEDQARRNDKTRTSQLEESLDKAAAEAGASRRDALGADASRLASDLFGRGSAKQAEAKRLADSGKFDAAIAAQKDAASYFRQAQRQAETAPGPAPKVPPKKPRTAVPAF